MYRYRVDYYRADTGLRSWTMHVNATDADDARTRAAIADPHFLFSAKPPRRMGPAPSCWQCKRTDVIENGIYTNVNFGGSIGIQHVCDLCREKWDEPEYVEWRGTLVEVTD